MRITDKLHRLIHFAVPVAVVVAAWTIYIPGLGDYKFLSKIAMTCAAAIYLVKFGGGAISKAALVVTTVLFSILAVEFFALSIYPRSRAEWPTSFSRRDLGWGPTVPGTFSYRKWNAAGQPIYDVTVSIGPELTRQVVSARSGPTIAFFGDSFTFGEGLPDAETLPQFVSDAFDRSWRVLNLGVWAYGPQQFLRAIEADVFADALRDLRVAIYQTAAWSAERTSCIPAFSARAPRYELIAGKPVYRGRCQDLWTNRVRWRMMESATYRVFLQPLLTRLGQQDVDLFVAAIVTSSELIRAKYGAPVIVLYLPDNPAYLAHLGISDRTIMDRLRAAGLVVIDGTLNPGAYVGQDLTIPGDGHPTGVANKARAQLLRDSIAAALP